MQRFVGGSSRTIRSPCTVFQRSLPKGERPLKHLFLCNPSFDERFKEKDYGSMSHASRIHCRNLGIGMLCGYRDFGFACLGLQPPLDRLAKNTLTPNGFWTTQPQLVTRENSS